jgi:trehalose-6-phosphate synthase
MPNGVEYEGRFVNVGTFPIGIDPDKFTEVSVKEDHGRKKYTLSCEECELYHRIFRR